VRNVAVSPETRESTFHNGFRSCQKRHCTQKQSCSTSAHIVVSKGLSGWSDIKKTFRDASHIAETGEARGEDAKIARNAHRAKHNKKKSVYGKSRAYSRKGTQIAEIERLCDECEYKAKVNTPPHPAQPISSTHSQFRTFLQWWHEYEETLHSSRQKCPWLIDCD